MLSVNDMGMFLLSVSCGGLQSVTFGGFSKISDAGFAAILQSCNGLERERSCACVHGHVCKKVESKGKTTYSEAQVADEIIAELTATNNNSAVSLDEFDEKNIRRRVYDALNVLMAMDIIIKDKKEIWWKGLHSANVKDMEEIKALRVKAMNRIEKKAAYLKELEEQIAGLQNLMLRNQQLLNSGNAPFGGFSLPFIVVRTNPHATVEIEISEDMQLVHLDFNSTPFSLHDDAYILKLLRRYQLPESTRISPSSSVLSSSSIDVASGGTKPFYWNSETETAKVWVLPIIGHGMLSESTGEDDPEEIQQYVREIKKYVYI
ncbi:hypothetical protein HYC85_021997 [Camellia sinensis]|uniref:E2F/DP family winged-helix DNA-binding domain-containing protein n=1 Tax=Camellia sinensis TaxID=4442 RepID=A0A7J7GJJ1_CAMSI|nr:hypothetical protein HYC85_021997 [Camellia sinensis]